MCPFQVHLLTEFLAIWHKKIISDVHDQGTVNAQTTAFLILNMKVLQHSLVLCLGGKWFILLPVLIDVLLSDIDIFTIEKLGLQFVQQSGGEKLAPIFFPSSTGLCSRGSSFSDELVVGHREPIE